MAKNEYVLAMQKAVESIPKGTRLLLHSCCGPCSSSVLKVLASHFRVTLLYYNPNIWPEKEYCRRKEEQVELLKALPVHFPVEFVALPYNPQSFENAVVGLEGEPEGGTRCAVCFALRLREAATQAADRGILWYTTTLTVSPHKNAPLLNRIGEQEAQKMQGVQFLPSDFKKMDGYKRSLELSGEYGLYRQDYCGCKYSYLQRYGEKE